MADLTQAEEASRYRKGVARTKMERVYAHVTMLRIAGFATTGATAVLTGMLKAYKPEWESAFYGLVIDGATAAVGGILFVVAGSKRSGDYAREVGGGIMSAALASLGDKGGRKLYEMIAA